MHEIKIRQPTKGEKPTVKPKKPVKSMQDKYPLNPDYLNQIVVLGKIYFEL